MSDGRIVRLAGRIGILMLVISLAVCFKPGDSRNSIMKRVPGYEMLAARVAAAADSGTAEAAAEQEAQVREALARIRIEPFADLDILKLERVEVVATGYTAGQESTGKSPGHPEYGITYSGVKVRKDHFSTIAADPSVFPIGTIMYVPDYGFGVVADTGGAIKGHKIDLYFTTRKQVYEQWGKRTVQVYIIRKGDGKVTEAMMNELNDLTKAVPADNRLDLTAGPTAAE